jgi:hypothetical protein
LLALSFRPVTVDVLLPSLFLEGRPVLHARRTSPDLRQSRRLENVNRSKRINY